MHRIHLLALSLFGACLLAVRPGPAGAEWLTFPSSFDTHSARRADQIGSDESSPVRGYLSVPVEPGRHAAVVLLHSCAGRKAFHVAWAQALSGRGYVALVVDDFFMQDRDRSCGITDAAVRARLRRLRLRHALGAVRYLAARADVDPARIAVMGWGDAPLGDLIAGVGGVPERHGIFRAVVAVTPERCPGTGAVSLPMLVLRAGSQVGGAGEPCAPGATAPGLELRVYPGTFSGFDDPEAGQRGSSGTGGNAVAMRRYDRFAHARAIEDVTAFLDRNLGVSTPERTHAYAGAPAPVTDERGTWAVDPREPGPDLPPAGGSTFDAVFSRPTPAGAVYEVPFPFPRLLAALERAAGGTAMPRSPLSATLIPLGRSLQREAAAPDYFASPRIVVAVTGGPEPGRGPLGLRLEDRLFLGYQPRAKVLEVISYNQAANRFEFQVVRDYGAGLKPRVYYARRALCRSCHQGAGPIFSEAGWDETTANPEVARRLRQALGAEFHGVPVAEAGRAVTAIDIAVREANLLPVYQRLWSGGCTAAREVDVARCRAGALQAMVQYALSGSGGFDRDAALYAEGYLARQRRNWTTLWPEGLLIPDPNLPDRAPLMTPMPSVVPAAQDPLRHRPPLARWDASRERDLERLVRGLAPALPGRDIERLDRYLTETGAGAPGRLLAARCRVTRRGFPGQTRQLQFECGRRADAGSAFYLQARIEVTPEGAAAGQAAWIEIGSGSYARRTLKGRVGETPGEHRITLKLEGRDGETSLRAPDGNAVAGFDLRWGAAVAESAAQFDAAATLRIMQDFRPVAALLERLAAEGSASSPLLAERFDGARLTGWLLAELGVRAAADCCASRPLPQARVETDTATPDDTLSVALEHRGPLLTFRRYCGACHGGDTTHPPGFLHGGGEAVLGRLAQCAQRIYYRLSMWSRTPEEQAVPPMPPPQGLSLAHTTAEQWQQSESLQRLTEYVRGLLAREEPDAESVLERGYHASRACLAQAGDAPLPDSP